MARSALARVLSVLVVAAACVLLGAPAQAAAPTVVSLTFDDGHASQYAVGTMLQSRGMKGTFYINSAMVGSSAYYMTWPQIHDLYQAGNEIGGHTLHHTNLTQVSTTQATTEVCDDRQALLAQGLGPLTSFAYPEAAVNATAESIAKSCGYSSGRDVGNLHSSSCPCAYAETMPPPDPYRLRTADGATSGTTLADLETSVINAENNGGGWVPFVFHGICDNSCTNSNSLTVSTFTAFLDWLQQRSSSGTVVRTVGDVISNGVAPQPPSAPTTTIACNGVTCSTGWYTASPVTVALNATNAASTFYTTDGSDPTSSSSRVRYAGPFPLSQTATVRFYSITADGTAEAPRSQTVRIDATAPAVTLTSPTSGATISRKSRTATLTADATDGPTGSGLQKVVFYDGSTALGTVTAPRSGTTTYAFSWNVRSAALRQHRLTAVATDVAGTSTTSTAVTVTVTR